MNNLPDELCEMIAARHPWAFLVVSRRFYSLVAPNLGAILAARRRFLHIDGDKWTLPPGDVMDLSLNVQSTKFAIVDSEPIYRTTIDPDAPVGVVFGKQHTGGGATVTTVVNCLFAVSIDNNPHDSGGYFVKVRKTDPRTGLRVTVIGVGYHAMSAREILQKCSCSVTARFGGECVRFIYAYGRHTFCAAGQPGPNRLFGRFTIWDIVKWVVDPDAAL